MQCKISAVREEIHGVMGSLRRRIYSTEGTEVRGACREVFLKDMTLKLSLTGM